MKSARATSHPESDATFSVVLMLLAGGVRPSPLRSQLDMPALCLPVLPHVTLLDRWLSVATEIPGCNQVMIAVTRQEDSVAIKDALEHSRSKPPALDLSVHVIMEPETWRGPAGLLGDLAKFSSGLSSANTLYIVGEASSLPPQNLSEVIAEVDPSKPGVSVTNRAGEPIGVYLFTDIALRIIPPLGFYDIKEQMLPALYARGTPIIACATDCEPARIWDRETYLRTVALAVSAESERTGCSPLARIDEAALVAGACLIEAGAVIDPHAIVHESIILGNAAIGRGAVVSHSIVGPSTVVNPGASLRRAVVHGNGKRRMSAGRMAVAGIFGFGTVCRGVRSS